MADEFQVGDHVDVSGVRAVVRYVGQADFAPGPWIGVELEVPEGKNNGTVMGVRYFDCEDKYGKFFRPSIPRLIERPLGMAHRGGKQAQGLSRIGSASNLAGGHGSEGSGGGPVRVSARHSSWREK